jgi:hypothetical protein
MFVYVILLELKQAILIPKISISFQNFVMIKAKELRVGNIVQIGEAEPVPITVFNISDTGINQKEVYDEDFPDADPTIDLWLFEYVHPIIITVDWLAKLGFTSINAKTKNLVWVLDDSTDISEFSLISDEINTPLHLYFSYNLGHKEIRKEIKYVHQLQNLYFAIIGQELPVSTKTVQ